MNEETRKLAITIAATIFAARGLTDWDGKLLRREIVAVQVFEALNPITEIRLAWRISSTV